MKKITVLTSMIAAIAIQSVWVSAQSTTAITYQGELQQTDSPANGSFDFQFELWDAASGGNQIGSTAVSNSVIVVDGRFAIEVDFVQKRSPMTTAGCRSLLMDHRWNPRQSITRAPYAIQTRGIFVSDDQSFAGIRRQDPLTANEVFGVHSTTTNNFGGMFTSTEAGGLPFYGYSSGGGFDAFHYFDGANDRWVLNVGSGTAMTVQANGNVGIGIADPGALLHIDGTLNAEPSLKVVNPGNSNGEVQIGSAAGSPGIIGISENGSRSDIRFSNSGLQILTSSDGSAPLVDNGLQVFAQGTVNIGPDIGFALARLTVGTSSDDLGAILAISDSPDTGFIPVAITGVDLNGGIGVVGTSIGFGLAGIGVQGDGQNFDFFADGPGVNYGAASSKRWKNNVQPIENAMDKLLLLSGVYFDWDKRHGGKHDIGMLAEEVGLVVPEIVRYEENGVDAVGMDYAKLTPLLVEAVKELNKEKNDEISKLRISTDSQIVALVRRIERLEREKAETRVENEDLQARVASLETLVEQLQQSK